MTQAFPPTATFDSPQYFPSVASFPGQATPPDLPPPIPTPTPTPEPVPTPTPTPEPVPTPTPTPTPTPEPTPTPTPAPVPAPTPTPTPVFAYHPDTISWRDRTSAAGSTVTDSHMMALNTFVESSYDLGLRDRNGSNHIILDLMPFMGSNLGGALTKLWFIPSAPTVVNYGFGNNDYSNETGITTNSGKYLESGIYPSQNLDVNSVSLGVYSLANVPSEGADFNADIPNANFDNYSRLLIHNPFTDNTIYFDVGNVTTGRTTASSNGDTKGLVVGSRLAANNTKIFRRGLQIGQNTNSGGQLPNVNLQLLTSPIAKPFGLLFVAKGIPENKQAQLNTLVHNLMVAIGRAT